MKRKKIRENSFWHRTQGSFCKVRLILGIPATAQDRRGLEEEDRAEKALKYLEKKES